jgi:hypothetical protein
MFGQVRPAVKNLLTVASSWTADQTFRAQRPAASSSTNQDSPAQILEGSAWNTSTSSPSFVAFRTFTQAAPGVPATGRWKLQYSLNRAAYTDALTWNPLGTGSKPQFTVNAYTVIETDNSSTIDTLQSLNVKSSGNTNHIVMSYGSTIRAGWSVNTQGSTDFRTAGTSPLYNFNVGTSITSQTMIGQIYSNGYYSSYSGYFGQQLTAGSPDTSTQTTLSSYGSTAFRGVLVNSSAYTLSQNETMVYCDPSNASFCVGTPSTVCSSILTESPCTAKNAVGCSWNSGTSCSGATGTDSSTCTNQGAGCVWDEVTCSGANNTDQSTCENQDDAFGGSCSWDTSTCPSLGADQGTCEGQAGCMWNFTPCSNNDGQSQATCEGNAGCSWTGAACSAFNSTDQSTCETGHTGCTWDSGTSECNGVYDEASTCAGQYDTSCSGDLCNGNYNNGNCSGNFGAGCTGTAACSNLSDDGSSVCNSESGCQWTVGITVTLPTTANALRGTTGRIYSIVHVGKTGTCSIQGQTGENIFQYTNMTLFKKGDKVLLHNQNISYPCSEFLSSSPCNAQAGCQWLIVCSTLGDESSCTAASCSWNGETNVCEGRTTAVCEGNYTTTDRWFAHSLERGLNYVEKTATYTLTDIDDVVNCTSGTFTLNLPSASLLNGKTYYLKNTGAGTITVDPFSTQTIDGASTDTISAGSSITIVSNNTNWIKI